MSLHQYSGWSLKIHMPPTTLIKPENNIANVSAPVLWLVIKNICATNYIIHLYLNSSTDCRIMKDVFLNTESIPINALHNVVGSLLQHLS